VVSTPLGKSSRTDGQCSCDPASANFGKHRSFEEVIEAFRPSQQIENNGRERLIDNGIPSKRISHSENKGWFAFYATAEEAENLLYTEYHEYEDSVTGGVMSACEEYHVPKHVRPHIDYIFPGIKLLAPPQSPKSKREVFRIEEKVETDAHPDPNDLSTCDIAITPACVAALYKIPSGHSKNPKNSMGVFESELQFYTSLIWILSLPISRDTFPTGRIQLPPMSMVDNNRRLTLSKPVGKPT
jgi:tripeptidyl-peptidase-1